MADGIHLAQRIHDNLTLAQVDAWHYGWLVSNAVTHDHEGLLGTSGEMTARLCCVGLTGIETVLVLGLLALLRRRF